MPKYIIRWNAGYGDCYDEIEADNEEEAEIAAYEAWKEDAEGNAEYEAVPWTKEAAENYLRCLKDNR